jgi:uncharacterized protein YjbJ (UPF0337 family)
MNTNPEKQQAEGNWDQAKGRVKEAAGALTGDADTKAEGQWDQTKGEIKEGLGELREKIRDNI